MTMRKLVCVLLCFLLIITSCYGCNDKTDPLTQAVIKYNLDSEPKSLDPQIAVDYSSKTVITNLFEGLCKLDSSGNVVPGVANSWNANKDHTSFTFKLRTDAVWSNSEKTPVTAHDFVFALKRAVDPNTSSDAGKVLYPIKNAQSIHSGAMDLSELGVRAIDNNTLQIDLEYEYNDFPKLMTTTVAMPCNEDFFKSTASQYGLECEYILSNGAYRFTNRYSWNHGTNISLSRNNDYHDLSNVIPGNIDFSIAADIANPVNAIVSETIDCARINGDNLQDAEKNNMNLTSFEDTTWGICFNLEDDVFKNLNIRKGFVKSLDKDYVVKNLPRNYEKADAIIPPGTTIAGENYRQQVDEDLENDYNPTTAKENLNIGLRQINKESVPNITVICTNSSYTKAMVSNMLELWNKNLGAYFNMNPVSEKDLEYLVSSGNYQVALTSLRAENDGTLEFLSIFKSGNAQNPARLKDKKYDSILDNILKNPGMDSISYCIKAEEYLNDNAVFYPVCFEKRYFASAFNVSDVIFYPYNGGIDFMQTKKQKV